MASRLTPCPSCSRHVKLGPPSCPFCGGAVPTDVPPRPVIVGRPLSRAAILFASAAAVTACGGSTSSPVTVPDDAAVDTGGAGPGFDASPLYGVVVIPHDAGKDAAVADAEPDVTIMNVDAGYGVFVNPDAGDAGDATNVTDASDAASDVTDASDAADARHDVGQGGAAYGVFTNPDGGF